MPMSGRRQDSREIIGKQLSVKSNKHARSSSMHGGIPSGNESSKRVNQTH